MSAGHMAAPVKFLEFCSRVISPNGYVRHKYNADGSLASSWHPYVRDGKPVLPIQEDETALVIWAVGEYFDRFHQIEEMAPCYRTLVTRPADFMLGYVDPATGLPLPSHDLWEERWGVHLYTVVSVIAGLRAAARITSAFGEETLAAQYRAGADRMFEAMMTRAVERARSAVRAHGGAGAERLHARHDDGQRDLRAHRVRRVAGGLAADDLHRESARAALCGCRRTSAAWRGTRTTTTTRWRRRDTTRVPGNPWFICTLWLARYRILRARTGAELAGGRDLIEWAAKRAFPSGVMAEQLHPYSGEPLSVSPLTWSHAAYISVVREYSARAQRLAGAEPLVKAEPAFISPAAAPATV